MKKLKSNKSKIIALVIAVFVIIVVFIIASKLEKTIFKDEVTTLTTTQNEVDTGEEIFHRGTWYKLNTDIETALVMGIDGFKADNNEGKTSEQADFIALAIIDHSAKEYRILHINRDTMTKIKLVGDLGDNLGTTVSQLALSHAYGESEKVKCQNTVWAASNLLYGININHYISFTMDAVPKLNDLVGGVTVSVIDDFSGIDSSIKQGEEVTLKGDQALTFVRSRGNMDNSTNVARMERQKTYITSFFDSFNSKSKSDSTFLVDVFTQIADYTYLSCSVTQLASLSDSVSKYTNAGFVSLEGDINTESPHVEFYPDETALKQTVVDLFYKVK